MLRSAALIPSIAATQALQQEQQYRLQRRVEQRDRKHRHKQTRDDVDLKHTQQQHHGKVLVSIPQMVEQLQKEEQARRQSLLEDQLNSSRAEENNNPGLGSPVVRRVVRKYGHVRTASMVDLLWQEVQSQSSKNEQIIKQAVARNERKATERIEREWNNIQNNNQGFVNEIKAYLALAEEEKYRKLRRLYDRWCVEVFDPVQQCIAQQIDSPGRDAALRQYRLQLFQFYLQQPTTSLAFTSTHAPSYDETGKSVVQEPPQLTIPPTHYDSGWIPQHDPTFATVFQHTQEQLSFLPANSLHTEQYGPIKPLFPATMWDKLEATPFGRYNIPDELANVVLSDAERQLINRQIAARMERLGLDHYDFVMDPDTSYRQYFGDKTGKKVRQYKIQKEAPYNIISHQIAA